MPEETLREKQSRFALEQAKLIIYAYSLGLEVTLGDAYRDPRVHGIVGEKKAYGHPKSAHKQRLAVDLNLFRNGKFLESSEDHRPLAEWWESQGADHRSGISFGDANHYSIEFNGVK